MNDLVLKRLSNLMKLRENVEDLESGQKWQPVADWLESDSHLILIMDLPGINPETLALQDDGETLQIAGSRENLELSGSYISRERPEDVFARHMLFPLEVVEGSAAAHLRNGVLTVSFEKKHKVINAQS